MAEYTIGSLCAGVGGLDLAVEDVFDAAPAWFSQYEPGKDGKPDKHQYAAQVLAKHWPDVPNLGDLTRIDWATVEPVDILTAGFPCQPVSNAGKRLGEHDDRWIWPHIARAVRVLRPRLVILENVAALVGRGLARVLADLAAAGFDAEWACVRASDIGAAHRRERIFVLAWPADAVQDPDCAAGGERRLAAPGQASGRGARPDTRGRGGAPAADPEGFGHGHTGTAMLTRVPPAAVGGGTPAPADTDRAGARPEPDREPHEPEAVDEHEELDALGRVLDWREYGPAIARWEHVMGRPAPAPTEPGKNGERLSPRFVEWLVGLTDGWVTDAGIPRNAQLKCLGNIAMPQQAAYAIRYLMTTATLLGHTADDLTEGATS
jgi:DNA (cytosine-5)-methyltransferase 1